MRPPRVLTALAVAATALSSVLVVLAAPAQALGYCRSDAGVVTCRFGYTGVADSFVVPDGVTSLSVTAAGGHGGSSKNIERSDGTPRTTAPGGRGAVVTGTVPVTPGQTVWLTVGGSATPDSYVSCADSLFPDNECGAGFNGGGVGAAGGGAGGGASDVRVGANTLAARVLVAAGGGGGGAQWCGPGGAGGDGGYPGADGGYPGVTCGTPGIGGAVGAADNGGYLGRGEDTARRDIQSPGGAGGGGYYGGLSGTKGQGNSGGAGNGGGAGGSNLVPTGGTAAIDTTGTPLITVRWTGPLPTPAPPAADPCVTTVPTVTCTYTEPGVTRQLLVPAGIELVHVVANGAPGGDGGDAYGDNSAYASPGGRGARVTGDVTVGADRSVYVTVGGKPTADYILANRGGANGGGSANSFLGTGGGGASDIRIGGTALADRVLVAAGGGGGGSSSCTRAPAGGDAGQPGEGRPVYVPGCENYGQEGGSPGTATLGGAGGFGAGGVNRAGRLGYGASSDYVGGSGGGGLYGGGAGGGAEDVVFSYASSAGGGGGSSLVTPGGTFALDDTRTPQIVVSYTLRPPSAPGGLTATAGNGSATIGWTAPASTGGSPVTGYTVTLTPAAGSGAPAPAAVSVPAGTTTTNVTGLTGGVQYSVSVTAANLAGTSPAATTSVVPQAPPALTGTAPAGVAGTAYSYAFTVTGTPAPVVSVASGSLPAGLTLSDSGVLSGVPTTAGSSTFTVAARNALGTATSTPQTVTVAAGAASALAATGGDGQSASAGKTFATPLAVTVTDDYGNPIAGAPVTFTVSSGTATFGGASTATTSTTAAGVATAPALTAGATAGPVTVTATSGTLPEVIFTETVLAAGKARADLKVTLSGVPATPAKGSSFTATVTVTNAGPDATTRGITVVDLGAKLKITAVTGGGKVTPRGGAASWTNTGLASGKTLTYQVTVSVGSPKAKVSTGLAAVTLADVTDPKYANNVDVARAKIS